ncbi:hypothetical protein [Candidatus Deianiraea vastatrix]|uniref:hypothetical protein n=1 Tax=Candidatus Deianiraea vastatrix TaxID=2163644 RepID=UPI0011BFCBC4|nr:hypothetical protein [Candidatus Deianiraea vastatrix]
MQIQNTLKTYCGYILYAIAVALLMMQVSCAKYKISNKTAMQNKKAQLAIANKSISTKTHLYS